MRDRQTVRFFIDTRSIRENVHTVKRGDEDDGDDEKSLSNRGGILFRGYVDDGEEKDSFWTENGHDDGDDDQLRKNPSVDPKPEKPRSSQKVTPKIGAFEPPIGSSRNSTA